LSILQAQPPPRFCLFNLKLLVPNTQGFVWFVGGVTVWQVAEKTERTCLRGWGCEVKGFAPVVGLGSILLGAYLFIVCGVVFWRAKQGSVTRARVQWSFIFLFPFWLAWYLVCVHVIAGKKTSTYKEAAFLVAVSLTRASDIRTYVLYLVLLGLFKL
jgi:hypothetical protein